VLIVVFVTTGDSVFVVNTQRPLDVEAGLSVFPRRRVVKRVRVGILGWMECGFGGLVYYKWLDIGSQQNAVSGAYTNAFSS
jgi:hypothetical protein